MKKMVLAAAALTVACVGAQAQESGFTSLGVINNVPQLIGDASVSPGLLFDGYTFSLSGTVDSILTGIATPLNLPHPTGGSSALDLSMFQVRLLDRSLSPVPTAAGPFVDTNPADGFTFAGLAAGNYALIFSGVATGTLGAAYSGTLFAAPIPEPGSVLMMIAGLAAVGFVVARRRARV